MWRVAVLGTLVFSLGSFADEPKSPQGFSCSATAWRAYETLPKKTDRATPVEKTHVVVESSGEKVGIFEPSKAGGKRFTEYLDFADGASVRVHGLLLPTGYEAVPTAHFVLELITRKDGKTTRILGKDGESWTKGEVSADISNLDVRNEYLAMGVSPYDDQGYDKLVPLIQSGKLPEGSVVGTIVHCEPKF